MARRDDNPEVVDGEIVPDAGVQPGQELEPYVSEAGELLLSAPIADKVRALLAHVPSENASGSDSIVEQLLGAMTLEQLAKPWQSTGGRSLAGRLIRIDRVEIRPSQFGGGVGGFLVVHSWDVKADESLVWTTSALAVVVQLARLVQEDWLPTHAEIVQAARPTAKGYVPYHLEFRPPPAANAA